MLGNGVAVFVRDEVSVSPIESRVEPRWISQPLWYLLRQPVFATYLLYFHRWLFWMSCAAVSVIFNVRFWNISTHLLSFGPKCRAPPDGAYLFFRGLLGTIDDLALFQHFREPTKIAASRQMFRTWFCFRGFRVSSMLAAVFFLAFAPHSLSTGTAECCRLWNYIPELISGRRSPNKSDLRLSLPWVRQCPTASDDAWLTTRDELLDLWD